MFIHIIVFNKTITHTNDTVCMERNIFFMGYQDNGISFGMNVPKQAHDLNGCFGIEVTRRLVG